LSVFSFQFSVVSCQWAVFSFSVFGCWFSVVGAGGWAGSRFWFRFWESVSRFVRVVGRDGRARPHFLMGLWENRESGVVWLHRRCSDPLSARPSFLPCLSVFVRGQILHVSVVPSVPFRVRPWPKSACLCLPSLAWLCSSLAKLCPRSVASGRPLEFGHEHPLRRSATNG
jgi:hypothetical protein